MEIVLRPVAVVHNQRSEPVDDHWNEIESEIVLAEHMPSESLLGICEFSHLEIIYFFDKVFDDQIVFSGRPRGNPNYPVVGIFGQRKKDRPNRIGVCVVELVKVAQRSLTVRRLDAINGTPVLDIKPVLKEFLASGEIRQPAWSADLMKGYW